MSFKDVIASDVHDTFMNADEFSDMHDLNGKMMPVQVDSNEQIEREKRFNQHMDGIYKNQKLIYVAATDYGPMPKQGSLIQFDKKATSGLRRSLKLRRSRQSKEDPAPSFYMTISRDHSHARLQEKTRSHRNTSHLTATQ